MNSIPKFLFVRASQSTGYAPKYLDTAINISSIESIAHNPQQFAVWIGTSKADYSVRESDINALFDSLPTDVTPPKDWPITRRLYAYLEFLWARTEYTGPFEAHVPAVRAICSDANAPCRNSAEEKLRSAVKEELNSYLGAPNDSMPPC